VTPIVSPPLPAAVAALRILCYLEPESKLHLYKRESKLAHVRAHELASKLCRAHVRESPFNVRYIIHRP
jgi:hypothetical protein